MALVYDHTYMHAYKLGHVIAALKEVKGTWGDTHAFLHAYIYMRIYKHMYVEDLTVIIYIFEHICAYMRTSNHLHINCTHIRPCHACVDTQVRTYVITYIR
jgi:hypothetical protein